MKVSTEIDNNFGYEKITQLVDNIPLTLNQSLKSHTLIQTVKIYFNIIDIITYLLTSGNC